ncbi:hypothetical protein DBR39_17480 [Chryseobacterium sp. KBW03]|uniref:hypothetical protein n=1 Tax=Chryseobacterium sp. KBW03 TaxID=2153362 RepID=UPI000F58F910|nr:hypothetical protein [Chryseobacterium sp. KBW03]RQO35488.1 hypothetical protein DBR39_17480 [Chryseobacterium sp. KBW03]
MKLTIPRPCHENWDNMTPEEKGKFCSVCSQSVYDFTDLSDEEISNFNFDQKICGRFREDQLGRNLNFSIAGKLTAGLFIAGGGLSAINAQEIKPRDTTIPTETSSGFMAPSTKQDTIKKVFRIKVGMVVSDNEDFLIILDNKEMTLKEYRALNFDFKTVESTQIIRDPEILKKYGEKAKNKVVIITTKKKK